MHLGQALNGFGGPVAMGAPPLLSAVWFPVHERTTSTAFGNVLNGFGVAVSFIIGMCKSNQFCLILVCAIYIVFTKLNYI